MSRKKLINTKSLLKLLPLVIVIIVLVTVYNLRKNNTQTPEVNTPSQPSSVKIETNNKREAEILSIINSNLTNKPGKYAVYIKDLKTNQSFEHNSNETFGSASIYKLAVMYKTYDEIEKGNLKKDDHLVGDKSKLDRKIAGSDEKEPEPTPQQSPKTVSFNVETALFEMITVSDNYSALLLADHLGWKNIDTFLKENSIENFDLVGDNSPTSTAKSVGELLEKIYSGSAVNQKYSQEMINLLLEQKFNDRIPKYLPTEIKVAHKTGELENVRHDAGIVYGKNSNYIFVFLTDTPNQDKAAENIAFLSQKLFTALENTKILN